MVRIYGPFHNLGKFTGLALTIWQEILDHEQTRIQCHAKHLITVCSWYGINRIHMGQKWTNVFITALLCVVVSLEKNKSYNYSEMAVISFLVCVLCTSHLPSFVCQLDNFSLAISFYLSYSVHIFIHQWWTL